MFIRNHGNKLMQPNQSKTLLVSTTALGLKKNLSL